MKLKLLPLLLLSFFLIAADLPPALPSSYYGVITGAPAGALITTNLGGSTSGYFADGWGVVYTLNVTGGTDGQTVQFYVNGQPAGSALYATGSNQRQDLVVVAPVAKVLKSRRIK